MSLIVAMATITAAPPTYKSVNPEPTLLDERAVAMLPLERERLANRLSAYVVTVLAKQDTRESQAWTRRLLGMALTVHPQNPRARLTDERLARGEKPPVIAMEWESDVLAKFLYQRAQQLFKPEHRTVADNAWLGHHLVALAAQVDPYFEDAVYAHELARLDGHAPDWRRLTGDSQVPITPASND